MTPETKSQVVQSEAEARAVVDGLMKASQWFEVVPLPDDEWRIAVKAGNHILLAKLATAAEGKAGLTMGWSESDRDGDTRDAVLEFRRNEREQAREDVLHAAYDAGFADEDDEELTPEVMKKVLDRMGSYAFGMGPQIWDKRCAKVLRAWDALEAIDEEAQRVQKEMPECPF